MVMGPLQAQGAAQPTIEELQAEIARLKAQLAEKEGGKAQAPTAPQTPATLPAEPAAAATEPAAEPSLEKVVVRSRNRLERVQDVPLSVSVIGGRELDRELALDIGAITKRAANVVRNVGNSRTYSLSIRGVGKVAQTEAQDTSVGMIVDGVNYAYAPLGSFDFYDVDSVEVARGPQGTLLGKNTTMGVINVTTRRPSFKPDANWAVTLGQYNRVIGQLAGGGPVVEDLLAWRGALLVDKGNGAFKNRYNPDQTYFDRDRVSGRLKLLLTPNPDFSALATVEIQPKAGEYYNGETVKKALPATFSNGKTTSGTTNDIKTKLARRWFTDVVGADYYSNVYLDNTSMDLDNQRALITATKGYSLELKWNLGEHDLTSITGYRDYHFHARNDEGTRFDVSLNGGGKVDLYKQFSQEIRLSSKQGGSVDYQVGALYFQNQVDFGNLGWNAGWGSDAGAWFATNAQYNLLDTDATGRLLLSDSLNGLNKTSTQTVKNRSLGIFGQADWRVNDRLTLTTGARITHENRKNKSESLIADNGFGGLLNPSAVNGVRLGGFDSYYNATISATQHSNGTLYRTYLLGNVVVANTTPGATATDVAYVRNGVQVPVGTDISGASATAGVSDVTIVNPGETKITTAPAGFATAVAVADAAARRYFGASATWATLTTNQQRQVAYAQAIRRTQIGTLWNMLDSPKFIKNQPSLVISPSYKIDDDHTTYATLQYGEKGGVSQVVNGQGLLAEPEAVTSLELGLKSAWLGKTLFLNTDVFASNIRNYQQAVVIQDPVNPAATVQYTGNAAKVRAYGLEVDGSYTGIKNTTVRFSGAYNVARYKSFPNSPQPVESTWSGDAVYPAPAPYRDVSGELLSGAARFTFNLGAEYRLPVFKEQVFHTSFNAAYTSKLNGDANLSAYGWIPSNWKVDASIGLGRLDQKFDATLVVKNLFNDRTPQNITWSNYVPADPRWFGIQFSGRF